MRNVNMRRQVQSRSQQVKPTSTAISKLVNASNRMGNPGIKNGQLTTIELYDYLPYVPATTLDFFEGVANRAFPFTNLNTNQLQVGESMVIKRIWFTIATTVAGVITNVQTFEQGAIPGQYLAQFAWFNNNNRVIKPLSLTNGQAEFNRFGWSTDNNVIHLETDITMQPLISFKCSLKLIPGAAVANVFIGCHVGGLGTILSPKGTF